MSVPARRAIARSATAFASLGALLMAAGPAVAQSAPPAAPPAAAPAATPAAASRPLTPETLWQIQRLSSPALSPDGAQAVVAVTRFDAATDRSTTTLHLVPTNPDAAARQLTGGQGSDTAPVWSPDGRMIAFVSRRGDDTQNQIYVIDVSGGEARRLTTVPAGASAPEWFPDSRQVAFLTAIWPDLDSWDAQAQRQRQRGESRMTAMVWDQAPFSYWDRFIDDRETHVFSVGLSDLTVRELTRRSGQAVEFRTPGADDFAISPDGLELAWVGESDRTGTRPDSDIFVVPVAGGMARNITEANPASDANPAYSPDGRHLAWTANRIPSAPDRDRLIVMDRASDAQRELSPGWDWSVSEYVWTPDSRGFLLAAEDRPTRRMWALDLRGGAPRRVTDAGDFTGIATAGGRTVALRSSFSQPPTLMAVDTGSGRATQLSRFNDALLSGVDMGAVESVTYPGANGRQIQMWVIRPPGFDPARRWPLHLLLHGGPHVGITDLWTYRWNAQVFAGWGYVVAWHNFHGSSGFGDAFADAINPDRTTLPYQDTIAAADWFRAQPWIDSGRMIASGGSYGGYLATVLLGRPHPFRALIAHAPVYNNYTQVGADYAGTQSRFDEFWENPALFQATSPHMQAANFNTPTLIIHGQQDLRVPVNHAFELFNTLQIRGVPSRLVYYPNENHWILRPQNSIFWYGQVRSWLDTYAPAGPR